MVPIEVILLICTLLGLRSSIAPSLWLYLLVSGWIPVGPKKALLLLLVLGKKDNAPVVMMFLSRGVGHWLDFGFVGMGF